MMTNHGGGGDCRMFTMAMIRSDAVRIRAQSPRTEVL